MIEIDPSKLDAVEFGDWQIPMADLNHCEFPPREVQLDGTVFRYVQSYPRKGYAAVAPRDIRTLLDQGRHVLMGERGMRLLLYQA